MRAPAHRPESLRRSDAQVHPWARTRVRARATAGRGPCVASGCPIRSSPPVHGDGAHAVVGDAGESRRLGDAVVRLAAHVERAAPDVGAEEPLARAGDGVEGGHRPAGGEEPAGRGREAHPVAQPVERVGLELHQRGGSLPDAGVPVGGVGDEVGERGGVDAATRDVVQVVGARAVEGARDPLVEQLVEQRLERPAEFGGGFAHRPHGVGRELQVCEVALRLALGAGIGGVRRGHRTVHP